MKRLICYTKFKLDPFSDGGSKRSVQIRELLEKNSILYSDESFALPKELSKFQLAKCVIRAVLFIHRHYPERIHSLSNYIRLIKYYALRIPVVLDKYMDQDVDFLWENTNDKDIVYLLKATGHRVIGVPHNLESLVHSKAIKALEKEVAALRCCDAVFAISKEETWLFRVLGLNAYFLPYYPPKEVESFLLSIRQKRISRGSYSRKSFLLLGSATNIPTRYGMQTMVDYISSKDISFDFMVAGYGTESLRKVAHPNVSYLGTLSNAELERMLLKTDGIIIYQPPTTGALTRIPEMLIAGIPVFTSFDATRNYFSTIGIVQYNSFDKLIRILSSNDTSVPPLFERDEFAESFFSSYVLS